MNSRLLVTLASCAASLGCSGKDAKLEPPQGQIVLYVTTDATLPPARGEVSPPDAPPALFDRLRIDIFPPNARQPCGDCSRDFSLDQVRVQENEASVGIVPPLGVGGYVARARLFRSVDEQSGEPPALSTIDVYAALPVVERDGIVPATIVLRVDDIGRTRGSLSAPTDTLVGPPDFSQIGRWPRANRVLCTGAARAGEACAPGGAFWMGDPHSGFHQEGADASLSRLVVLSPFFVDLHEVTVAEYRASKMATLQGGSSIDPLVGAADSPPAAAALSPEDPQYFCTYSDAVLDAEKSREKLPLNCVSWSAASAFCAAQGKRLPSEAEYEYLAGGLRSDPFVWGSSVPICGDSPCCENSVWGRGGFDPGNLGTNMDCRTAVNDLGGPLPPGSAALDRLDLDGREVVDLMGNVSEWTRDYWNRISEPCWAGRALLDNPVCDKPSGVDASELGELRTVKGEAWDGLIYPASARLGGEGLHPMRGFRCVRADE